MIKSSLMAARPENEVYAPAVGWRKVAQYSKTPKGEVRQISI